MMRRATASAENAPKKKKTTRQAVPRVAPKKTSRAKTTNRKARASATSTTKRATKTAASRTTSKKKTQPKKVDWSKRTAAEVIDCIKSIDPNKVNTDIEFWCRVAKTRSFLSEKMSIVFFIHQHLTNANVILWNARPLTILSVLFWESGYTWLSKFYMMLALCNEAKFQGTPLDKRHDSYNLGLGLHGMAETELQTYGEKAIQIHDQLPDILKPFPEAVLTRLDQDWKTGVPSTAEYGLFYCNGNFIRKLLKQIEYISSRRAEIEKEKKEKRYKPKPDDEHVTTKDQGDYLEFLGRYLMSCMPGTRINTGVVKQDGTETDYDVVCSLDGFQVDFRTELGRYFICECKAYSTTVDFTITAKFSRVLDSVRSKFGIIFSLNGLTGDDNRKNAGAEQLHIYRDRGIIIVSIDKKDMEAVSDGINFINVLRKKYDDIRLFKLVDDSMAVTARGTATKAAKKPAVKTGPKASKATAKSRTTSRSSKKKAGSRA